MGHYDHSNVLLKYVLCHQYNHFYICNSLDKFYKKGTYFYSLMGKNPINFYVICFIDILDFLLESSSNFWINSFNLFSLLSKNQFTIEMRGFCFSNKLGGVINESSKSLVELIKSLTISHYCIHDIKSFTILFQISKVIVKEHLQIYL